MEKKLIVSSSPHIRIAEKTNHIMTKVLLAMLPAYLCALYFFGFGALLITAVSMASCVLFEYVIQKFILKQKSSIHDGSALVTGLLLAFNLPSNLPIWLVILGALVAIGIGKMAFGGIGNNPFNPALVGRVFLLISFPVQMTSWPTPVDWSQGFNLAAQYIDAATGATTLSLLKENAGASISMVNMLVGNMGGSLGEVSAIALLLGGLYLLFTKVISWHIPVAVLGSAVLLSGILYAVDPTAYVSPDIHLLTGGMLLGAFFMATDYSSSPMSNSGKLIFGVGIGLITIIIRQWGAYPEGVSFAILIMNAFTPLINNYVKPKVFGKGKING